MGAVIKNYNLVCKIKMTENCKSSSFFSVTIELTFLLFTKCITSFSIEVRAQYCRTKNSLKVDGMNKYNVIWCSMTQALEKNLMPGQALSTLAFLTLKKRITVLHPSQISRLLFCPVILATAAQILNLTV